MSSENIPRAKSQTRMMLGKQRGRSLPWPENARLMQCEILVICTRLHSNYAELFTLCQPGSIKLKNCITSEMFCF